MINGKNAESKPIFRSSSQETPCDDLPPEFWDLGLENLEVPAGWEPIARLCSAVAADADGLVTTVVRRIRAQIPHYRADIPEEDLRRSVEENLRMVLRSATERRGPLPDELAIRGQLGLRRAQQGLPVDAVLEAFVLGYQVFWTTLVEHPLGSDAATQRLLLKVAVIFWDWVQGVTDSVRTTYYVETQRRAALTTGRRERLMDAILKGNLGDPELPSIASALGLNAAGHFTGIVADVDLTDPALADRITTALRALPGRTHAVARSNLLFALSQDQAAERVVEAIVAERSTAVIAIGLERSGLQGARNSIADARRTLPIAARDRQPRRFEEAWLAATLIADQDPLQALLAPGIDAATEHPTLAETVRAYAESGQSLSRAAKLLFVHLNTISYRLSRWHEKTGWDPRAADGLSRSTAAIEIATTRSDMPAPE